MQTAAAQDQSTSARKTCIGSGSVVWFAYVGGAMLRDVRGVGRAFKSEAAALRAAANAQAAQ